MAAIGFALFLVGLLVIFLLKRADGRPTPYPNAYLTAGLAVFVGFVLMSVSIGVLLWRNLP
jgi:hypothetical protein